MTHKATISVGDYVTYTKGPYFWGRVLAIVKRKNGTVRYVVERELGSTLRCFTKRALTAGKPEGTDEALAECKRIDERFNEIHERTNNA